MTVIKTAELAHVRVRVPDLDLAERFLSDFGQQRSERTGNALYVRGSGTAQHVHSTELGDPKFVSVAFTAHSEEDLPKLSRVPRRLPGREHRSARRRQVTSVNPRPVVEWYQQTLGLLWSDEVVDPQGNLVLSFNRLDKGEEYVDHHALMIQGGPRRGLNHVAFGIRDVDDLMIGHEHLQAAGYDNVWGIGRHVYGAQVFDYWMDPWAFMYEHWTDTDRVNAGFQGILDGTFESVIGPWGAAVPERFVTHAHE